MVVTVVLIVLDKVLLSVDVDVLVNVLEMVVLSVDVMVVVVVVVSSVTERAFVAFVGRITTISFPDKSVTNPDAIER